GWRKFPPRSSGHTGPPPSNLWHSLAIPIAFGSGRRGTAPKFGRRPGPPCGMREIAKKKGRLQASGPSLGRKRPRRAAVRDANHVPHCNKIHRIAQNARGGEI